jgi:hypothetical protein
VSRRRWRRKITCLFYIPRFEGYVFYGTRGRSPGPPRRAMVEQVEHVPPTCIPLAPYMFISAHWLQLKGTCSRLAREDTGETRSRQRGGRFGNPKAGRRLRGGPDRDAWDGIWAAGGPGPSRFGRYTNLAQNRVKYLSYFLKVRSARRMPIFAEADFGPPERRVPGCMYTYVYSSAEKFIFSGSATPKLSSSAPYQSRGMP